MARRGWRGTLAGIAVAIAGVSACVAAVPARGAVVSMVPSSYGAPFGAEVVLIGGPSEQVNAVVTGVATPGGNALPTTLLITDLPGTLTTIPGPTSGPPPQVPCTITAGGHLATCQDAGSIFSFNAALGSADDSVVAGAASLVQPEWFVDGGGGNDLLSTVLASPDLASKGSGFIRGGAGNDTIIVGPGLDRALGGADKTVVDAGDGNDLVETVNAAVDDVDCGAGNDTWIADPTDEGTITSPSTNCETRLPAGSSTALGALATLVKTR
jgi:hypothetical protein